MIDLKLNELDHYTLLVVKNEQEKIIYRATVKVVDIMHELRKVAANYNNNEIINFNILFNSKDKAHPYNEFSKYPESKEIPQVNMIILRQNQAGMVECIETGATYRNQSEAAKAFNTSPGNMSRHLRGDRNYKRVKGFTFRYKKIIDNTQ